MVFYSPVGSFVAFSATRPMLPLTNGHPSSAAKLPNKYFIFQF